MSEEERSLAERLRAHLAQQHPGLAQTLSAVGQAMLFTTQGLIVSGNEAAAQLLGVARLDALTGLQLPQLFVGEAEAASLPARRCQLPALDGRLLPLLATPSRFPFTIDGHRLLIWRLEPQPENLAAGLELGSLLELFERSADAILVLDEAHLVVGANASVHRLLGWRVEQLVGQPFEALLAAPAVAQALWGGLEVGAPPASLRLEARRRSGGPLPMELSLGPLVLGGQRFIGAALRDRSDTEASERALHASEHLYRAVFDNALDGIFVADAAGTYLDVNPSGCAMLGYSRDELLGMRMQELTSSDEAQGPPLELSALAVGRRTVVQRLLRCKSGALLPVEISASRLPDGKLQGVVRDLSERRRQEEALRQASKLDAVGRLAGGVAHDFNNILTVILSLASALEKHVDADGAGLVSELEQTGARAAELTKQLLAFARRQPANPQVIDLNEQVRVFSRFLLRSLGEDVRLELTLCDGPLYARLDPVHFEQILLNLAVNARDAMPQGGVLTIASHASDSRAFLVVSDSGSGMSEQTMGHLFEPFFTTKERGRGTGLGLATVYGIVTQNHGELTVSSELGHGTRFVLAFPSTGPALAPPPELATPLPSRQGLSILVVEDDPSVRKILQRSLKADGHLVYAVGSLAPALQIVKSGAGIELLISDVVMPEAGGKEVADAVRALLPGVPIIFVSGYSPNLAIFGPLGDFLSKPFTQASLRAAVAMAMRRRS